MSVPSKRSPFGISAILGALLVLSGLGFLGYSLGVYFEWLPGSRVTVPDPVALEQPRPTSVVPTAAPTPTIDRAAPTATPRPVASRPEARTAIREFLRTV